MIIVSAETVVVPPEPPPVDLTPEGFGMALIGGDGVVWDLNSGPVYAAAGTAGPGQTDPTHWFNESPTTDGARWTGLRYANDDDFPLVLEVTKGNADKWVDVDRALWRSIVPEVTNELAIILPDNTFRTRTLRYKSGGDAPLDESPWLYERALYELSMIADPFWKLDPVVKPYVVRTSGAFFPGPPFTIGPGNTVFNSKVDNLGDFPVWPKWVIGGPYTSATVGVGSSVVTLNGTVNPGDSRIIDMTPEVRDITKQDGSSAWSEADPIAFRKIPVGKKVPLTIAVTGATTDTTFELSFQPICRRGW